MNDLGLGNGREDASPPSLASCEYIWVSESVNCNGLQCPVRTVRVKKSAHLPRWVLGARHGAPCVGTGQLAQAASAKSKESKDKTDEGELSPRRKGSAPSAAH